MAKALFEKFITTKGFITIVMTITVAALYVVSGEIPQTLSQLYAIIIYDFFTDKNDNGFKILKGDTKDNG